MVYDGWINYTSLESASCNNLVDWEMLDKAICGLDTNHNALWLHFLSTHQWHWGLKSKAFWHLNWKLLLILAHKSTKLYHSKAFLNSLQLWNNLSQYMNQTTIVWPGSLSWAVRIWFMMSHLPNPSSLDQVYYHCFCSFAILKWSQCISGSTFL